MINRSVLRFAPARLAGVAMILGAAAWSACSSDDAGVPVDVTVRITETNFIPNEVTVESGSRIEWQNRHNEARTVTSGHDATDLSAGQLFDVTLRGYRSGEAVGGIFQRVFVSSDTLKPDTIEYFSRLVPPGFASPFRGRVIVTPH